MTHLRAPYFQSVTWTYPTASAVMAAMKTVATLQDTRPLDAISREMLEATRDWVLKETISIDDLTSISPADFAQQLQDQRQRQQALQFLILMPYLDTQVDPAEVNLVNAYAAELQLTPHTLQSLRLVCDRKLRHLLVGYTHRSITNILPGRGLWQKAKVVFDIFRQYLGDKSVAQRYQALELLPDNTLGKELYRYYRDRNFPLPGEKQSFSEAIVGHDLLHLLSGIGTDMEGEITVAGLEAGMSNSEFGFELLLEVILDFHMGLKFTTMGVLETGLNQLKPQALMEAYARGLQMPFDLLDPAWNFKAVLEQPIPTLRQLYRLQSQSPLSLATVPS
ncbi:MAG: hypothetical protein F6K11_13730 [Leptolyngbya sp. SIO3F4]|nr:hypothetical protein [Leptolyngbya sp. SIO3F4]